ncbi:Protein arginine N-methyltransferase skb1 [Schizosaccharomyces pombe]|nr:protein arginine N-methyltransferase Skb1 [Schizosaccharomyces pombe]P78963.2 RecName: Full=Protein arginine N-methyltransferase skb1; AltName: Full=Shk1 kinase-binding protein 1; AltName: Full=Type II protein arginine N-methyltransferase; Short=Type II PRMT [Schizosaccharomyces pombe 972h-]CAA17909.1 type II protein arginine N-methyltransferase Skb1 [Schizosaccharomyces pombe]|eukprot:NP_595936.1 protein arginine N-methyltransferase Skb1 [Schizosaccharomyces pombe]
MLLRDGRIPQYSIYPLPVPPMNSKTPTLGIVCSEGTISLSLEEGFEFVGVPLSGEGLKLRVEALAPSERLQEFLDDEVAYHPEENVHKVVGLSSAWLELDSEDTLIADRSEEVLLKEASYASYCGLSSIILNGPTSPMNVMRYARAVSSALNSTMNLKFLVQLAIESGHEDYFETWKMWDTIRSACGYHPRLKVALELPPACSPPIELVNRWYAEPIEMITMSCMAFVPNPNGYPVLGRKLRAIYALYLRLNPRILLWDNDAPEKIGDSPDYSIYMKHLFDSQPPAPLVEDLADSYKDYLQVPLQPLSYNLENITYEIFERDPVKYAQYEQAIFSALMDRDESSVTRIAVVGAGRGPLVDCALRAAISSSRTVDMIALEKNPNAFSMLLMRNRQDWAGKVTLVFGDMRTWNPDYKIDILVSELLGSMGDNELSPECLDGVQHVLDEETGICIPSSYISYVTPIMSPKLWSEARNMNDPNAFERQYVVLMNSFDFLAADDEFRFQSLWSFHHPNKDSEVYTKNLHNKRFASVRFQASSPGILHGFAGYFEATLYKDISLSIMPATMEAKSPDMFSWFPIYMPIKKPMYVPENSQLEFHMWRLTDGMRVWFEWCANAYLVLRNGSQIKLSSTEVHNISGKAFSCNMY